MRSFRFTRRVGLICTAFCLVFTGTLEAQTSAATETTFDALRQRAAELARQPFKEQASPTLPDNLAKLNYDQYQLLKSNPTNGPWRKLNLRFDLGFMHRGYLFKDAVKFNVIDSEAVQPLTFSRDYFDYRLLPQPFPVPDGIGFAGFKLLFAGPRPNQWDEVASFLGASYFRLVGQGQQYGASARALAIDTGEDAGEEFPRFTEFWFHKPAPLSDRLQLMAFLDSPSVAGACLLIIHPGETTTAEVDACIYPRKEGKKLGFAPLTSMFLMGENRTRFIPDFRPEVHDSDGLLMEHGNERLWRPLVNPERKHTITRFAVEPGTRFGLLQRDRNYQSYEDLVAHYHKRPGFWVEPLNDWGKGTVELVEIPTPNEYNDNIVAYWVPARQTAPGGELRYRYRLSTVTRIPEKQLLEVEATRITPSVQDKPPRFVVDFKGTSLAEAGVKGALKARPSSQPGEVKNVSIQRNEVTGGWRVSFDLVGSEKTRAEVRLALESDGQPVSETWVYSYAPPGA